MSFKNLRIAYITSMAKGGLAGFNFREISEMVRNKIFLVLFLTKYVEGPYGAPKEVETVRVNPIMIIFNQIKNYSQQI